VPVPVVDAVEQLATVSDTLELGPVLVVTLKMKLQGKAGLQQVTANLAFVSDILLLAVLPADVLVQVAGACKGKFTLGALFTHRVVHLALVLTQPLFVLVESFTSFKVAVQHGNSLMDQFVLVQIDNSAESCLAQITLVMFTNMVSNVVLVSEMSIASAAVQISVDMTLGPLQPRVTVSLALVLLKFTLVLESTVAYLTQGSLFMHLHVSCHEVRSVTLATQCAENLVLVTFLVSRQVGHSLETLAAHLASVTVVGFVF